MTSPTLSSPILLSGQHSASKLHTLLPRAQEGKKNDEMSEMTRDSDRCDAEHRHYDEARAPPSSPLLHTEPTVIYFTEVTHKCFKLHL